MITKYTKLKRQTHDLRNSGRPVEPENRRSTSRTPNKGRVHVNLFFNFFIFLPTKSSFEHTRINAHCKNCSWCFCLPCATHDETKEHFSITRRKLAWSRFRKSAKIYILNFLKPHSACLYGAESGYVWAPLPTPPVDITGYVWAPLPQAN